MTPLQMHEAICEAARVGVGALSGPPMLILPDERGKPVIGTAFVRLAIISLAGTTMTHGPTNGRRATRRNYIIAQCFAPSSTVDGSGAALALAQGVRDLYEGKTITAVGDSPTDINFTTADIKPKGMDGAWVRADVEADFTYGESR